MKIVLILILCSTAPRGVLNDKSVSSFIVKSLNKHLSNLTPSQRTVGMMRDARNSYIHFKFVGRNSSYACQSGHVTPGSISSMPKKKPLVTVLKRGKSSSVSTSFKFKRVEFQLEKCTEVESESQEKFTSFSGTVPSLKAVLNFYIVNPNGYMGQADGGICTSFFKSVQVKRGPVRVKLKPLNETRTIQELPELGRALTGGKFENLLKENIPKWNPCRRIKKKERWAIK